MEEKKAKRTRNKYQLLVEKFVSSVQNRYFWPKEIKFAKQLIEKYSFEFLIFCDIPYGYKVNSLLYFLGPQGIEYLAEQKPKYDQYIDYLRRANTTIKLEDEKIGDDVLTNYNKKPTTLKEFLNVYGKKD